MFTQTACVHHSIPRPTPPHPPLRMSPDRPQTSRGPHAEVVVELIAGGSGWHIPTCYKGVRLKLCYYA